MNARCEPRRQGLRRFSSAAVVIVLAALAACGHLEPAPDLVRVQVLGFNDYHGHLTAEGSGRLEGQRAGGGLYLASQLKALRQGQAHSVTVAAGDLIGASPAFSSMFRNEPSVESLNAMDLAISSVGNHEFDQGVDELLRMQHGGCHPVDGCFFPDQPYAGAEHQWLAANVLNEATGEPVLPPYAIRRFDGVPVAFIGMTLQDTGRMVLASGVKGWRFADEVATANRLVPQLQAQGVQAMVVLLHEGLVQQPAPGDINACHEVLGPVLAINQALDPAIDAMITGHTHQPYNCRLTDAAGQARVVTSAYAYGRVLTELTLVLDKRSGDVRRDLTTARNHAVLLEGLAPDPDVARVVAKWRPLYEAKSQAVVGRVSAAIRRAETPGGAEDRSQESALGRLVADAQLAATAAFGADMAFMNAGGMRADLLGDAADGSGVVRYADTKNVQPFGNALVLLRMTGAEILSALTQQCRAGGFSMLSVSRGFSYDLRRRLEDGRCVEASLSQLRLQGQPLREQQTYGVVVNDYLAQGGGGFSGFAQVPAERRQQTSVVDTEALLMWLRQHPVLSPDPVARIRLLD